MSPHLRAAVTATGHYLPDEQITARVGIRERQQAYNKQTSHR